MAGVRRPKRPRVVLPGNVEARKTAQKLSSAISKATLDVVPRPKGFNRRKATLDFDVAKAMRFPRNGMRPVVTMNFAISREQRYQRWLLRVGGSGTRPEFMVFESLERKGYRSDYSDPPGNDFRYQAGLLGGRVAGGAVADLLVESAPAGRVVIRVQGEFWHYGDDAQKAADMLQALALESAGFVVVDVLAQDTITEAMTDEVVGLALLGMQRDVSGRMGVSR